MACTYSNKSESATDFNRQHNEQINLHNALQQVPLLSLIVLQTLLDLKEDSELFALLS